MVLTPSGNPTDRTAKNKSAADSPGQPRFCFSFIGALIGLWLLVSSAEAPPSLWQSALSAASPLCPSTVIGNSVPPKEPPLLRCKAPPPKRLATSIKELTRFTTLLPSCRHWLEQWSCHYRWASRTKLRDCDLSVEIQ